MKQREGAGSHTICKLAIDVASRHLVDLGGTVLACNNVGACSWADRLLGDLAIADGVGSLPHVGINVGQDVDTSVLVDVVNAVLLRETLSRHVVESVDDDLESAAGEGRVGSLHILVVGHVLIEDSLLGKLIDLCGVSNLGLVLECCFVLNVWANVQEVADNAGITHPRVDGSLHLLGLVLADLTRRVTSIASVNISSLLGVGVSAVVVIGVAVGGLVAGLAIARVGV